MIKLDIQMFGGRGASSSINKERDNTKLQKVYREYSYGKELVGYKYRGYDIEVTDYAGKRNNLYGATHRWYETKLQNGEGYASDILREVKEKLDNDVLENRKKK